MRERKVGVIGDDHRAFGAGRLGLPLDGAGHHPVQPGAILIEVLEVAQIAQHLMGNAILPQLIERQRRPQQVKRVVEIRVGNGQVPLLAPGLRVVGSDNMVAIMLPS